MQHFGMLTPKAQYDLKSAKEYFSQHLSVGDYYSQSEHVQGLWIGTGAERLGLSGSVSEEAFHRLCENRLPDDGDKRLTPYQKKHRKIFYDWTISPPKSVSLVALMLDDHRLVDAHDRAATTMMEAFESFAGTQDHREGQRNRRTGNIVGAQFRHETSRDLDPFLHTHCIVFNATWDETREKWMAYESAEMYRAQKFAENLYYHELAKSLRSFGYDIVNSARGDFEIAGVSRELVDVFSKRHQSILESVEAVVAENPELESRNAAAIREYAAQWNRPQKQDDSDKERMRKLWMQELSPAQQEELRQVKEAAAQSPSTAKRNITVQDALSWAEEHLFSRRSVVEEQELWRYALSHGRGHDFSHGDLKSLTDSRKDFLRERREPWKLTTQQALDEEDEIIRMVNEGLRAFAPFVAEPDLSHTNLKPDQRDAAQSILDSRAFLSVFRGGAGTGKSFTLNEVRQSLLGAGFGVAVVTPQNQQAIDLEGDGLLGAQTVSKLLTTRKLPPNPVVILDEAGQLDRIQMLDLVQLVSSHGGRMICSGDTRQHGSVGASSALEAIERYSNLKTINLNKIWRQDPSKGRDAVEKAFIKGYLHAVELAAKGKIAASFDTLDSLGAITETPSAEARDQLAKEYLRIANQGESVVVVSQSWSEIHHLNTTLRESLRESEHLKGRDYTVESLQPRDLTNAQKRDERYYDENSIIVFNRPCMGFQKGERTKLFCVTKTGLIVEGKSRIKPIHFKHLDKLTVTRPKDISISKGEMLQLKANGRSVEGKRLANGEIVTVKGINKKGVIRLSDGRTLPKDYRQFLPGYAVTSYGSQGKTKDHVLFADSAVKAATNAEQWYVTISRGRKGIRLFTPNKEELRDHVSALTPEPLALDIQNSKRLLINGFTPAQINAGLALREKRQSLSQNSSSEV